MTFSNPNYSDALNAELEPIMEALFNLSQRKFTIAQQNELERCVEEKKYLENNYRRIKHKHGLFIDSNIISDDRDDRYGTYAPKITYTIGAGMHCLFKVAPENTESCYDLHEWLLRIKAISSKVAHDHEYSGLFYYFSTHKSAENFITKINTTLDKLFNKR